jgi:hypothetical protein
MDEEREILEMLREIRESVDALERKVEALRSQIQNCCFHRPQQPFNWEGFSRG